MKCEHRWSGWTMQMTSPEPGGGRFYARYCLDCMAMERGEVDEGRNPPNPVPVPYRGDPDEALPGSSLSMVRAKAAWAAHMRHLIDSGNTDEDLFSALPDAVRLLPRDEKRKFQRWAEAMRKEITDVFRKG